MEMVALSTSSNAKFPPPPDYSKVNASFQDKSMFAYDYSSINLLYALLCGMLNATNTQIQFTNEVHQTCKNIGVPFHPFRIIAMSLTPNQNGVNLDEMDSEEKEKEIKKEENILMLLEGLIVNDAEEYGRILDQEVNLMNELKRL